MSIFWGAIILSITATIIITSTASLYRKGDRVGHNSLGGREVEFAVLSPSNSLPQSGQSPWQLPDP